MKRTVTLTLATSIALLGAALPSSADEALAKAKGCTACHAVDKKLVGPAYKDVAKKHKGEANAQATMVNSILKGSQGKFGQVPMPPNKVTEDEAKKLAAWILSL
jgi:cytochrome c